MPDIITRSGRRDILSMLLGATIEKLHLFESAWYREPGVNYYNDNNCEDEFYEDDEGEDVEDGDYFDKYYLIISPETYNGVSECPFKNPLQILAIYGAEDGFGIKIAILPTHSYERKEVVVELEDLNARKENIAKIIDNIFAVCGINKDMKNF